MDWFTRQHPTFRLTLLSILLGIAGAAAGFVFLWLLSYAQALLLGGIAQYVPPTVADSAPLPPPVSRWWIPVVTTLGGLLSVVLVSTFAPEAEGHGTDAFIKAYHRDGGFIRGRVPIIKALASAITIGSGGGCRPRGSCRTDRSRDSVQII